MTSKRDDVELVGFGPPFVNDDGQRVLIEQNFEPAEGYSRTVPSADGGKDAWLFLAACFMVEALVWGFPFSFGIFQEYYGAHEPFAGSGNNAVIGTCSMVCVLSIDYVTSIRTNKYGQGIMYLDAPLLSVLFKKWPQLRRSCTVIGLLTMCLAVALSSFAQNVTHLILTQGILYSIGGSIVYYPTILFVNEWFIKRKGLAFGIMYELLGSNLM
jgi:hypothetical protein